MEEGHEPPPHPDNIPIVLIHKDETWPRPDVQNETKQEGHETNSAGEYVSLFIR